MKSKVFNYPPELLSNHLKTFLEMNPNISIISQSQSQQGVIICLVIIYKLCQNYLIQEHDLLYL